MERELVCAFVWHLGSSTFRTFHINTRTSLGIVAMSTEPPSAYELLGVSQDAREEEINKAFRQRSLKVHPDRNPTIQRPVGILFSPSMPPHLSNFVTKPPQMQPQNSTSSSLLKNSSLTHYEELNLTHHYGNNARTRKSMRNLMQSGRPCKTISKNANGNSRGRRWKLLRSNESERRRRRISVTREGACGRRGRSCPARVQATQQIPELNPLRRNQKRQVSAYVSPQQCAL
jgi:hypothetical protein